MEPCPQQVALFVPPIDESFNPDRIPQTAEEYLQQVIYERTVRLPEVVSNHRNKPEAKPSTTWDKLADSNLKNSLPEEVLPTSEWTQIQLDIFQRLREKIQKIKEDESLPQTRKLDSAVINDWKSFCQENPPLLKTVLSLSQSQWEDLLEQQSEWLDQEKDLRLHAEHSWMGQWIYASLANLMIPIEPNVHHLIREIARTCIRRRNELRSSQESSLINNISAMDMLNVKIVLEIHAVTCPGVWLCQSGPVKLMIRSLGYTFYTAAVTPRFPMIFHETFTIEGYFKDVHSANDLRLKLISEPIDISLYQNGHRLAFFRESLASLLAHQNCKNVLDVELLMSTTKCFPGILSPKVETQITFTVRKYNPVNDCVHASSASPLGRRESLGICWGTTGGGKQQQHGYNHAKLDEKQSLEERRKRQRAVCHKTQHMHINSENTANFVPLNVMPRKASDSSNSTEASFLGGAAPTAGGIHFSMA